MNWLLLRGLARTKEHWGVFPLQLAQASGKKVECLDLPGFGSESNQSSPTSIPAIVDNLRSRFKKNEKQNQGQWGILGHSLGGMVAIDWASRYPQDFETVVTLNTSFKNLSSFWQRLKPNSLFTLLKILKSSQPIEKEKGIISLVSNLRSDDPEVIKEWSAILENKETNSKNFLRQLYAASRFSAPSILKTPLVVLASRQDKMVSHKCSVKLAECYQAQLRLHPKAGHDMALDATDWLVNELVSLSK